MCHIKESFFGKPCFQLTSKSPGTATDQTCYKFYCDSQDEIDAWVSTLRKYTSCCSKCSETYRYDAVSKYNSGIVESVPFSYQSLQLTILEMKDVKSNLTNAYCIIAFDEVKYAKTEPLSENSLVWDHPCNVAEMCPHWKKLSIVILSTDKNKKDTFIGIVLK